MNHRTRSQCSTKGTKLLAAFAVTICILDSNRPASAITVGWHDQMYLQVGDAVNLNRQKEATSPGLVSVNLPGANQHDGYLDENVTFAQHTYDMIKTLSVNSSVSLNSFVADGDVAVSFFGRQTFDANDLRFVFTETRNFGTTLFSATNFSSAFWASVSGYRKNLHGAALHASITSAFGTHYVAGYQSAAIVSVAYSFHYASASTKQQLSIAASGSAWDAVSFSAFVSSFFGSTNTAASMSYQFYSTDPLLLATNFGFAAAGSIRSFQQFTNFVKQVESYSNGMSPARARITEYVLNPIQVVPGYLALLEGYIPPPLDQAHYSDFLQTYSALKAWKQQVDPLVLNGDAMSWLNAQGRQLVQAGWLKAGGYLADLKAIALGHFTTNGPLNVPAEVADYLANLSIIRLPYIYVMDSFASGSSRYIFGRVDCGCRDLTIPIPFSNLSELYYQTNNGTVARIYYDAAEFASDQLKAYPSGTIHTRLLTLFTNSTAQWSCLTNSASNPDLNGFFLVTQTTSQSPNWSVQVSAGTDANGNAVPVDTMAFLDTRSGNCPASCLITITNLATAPYFGAAPPAGGETLRSTVAPPGPRTLAESLNSNSAVASARQDL